MQGTNHGTASPCSRTGAPRPARLGGDASALQWTLCSRTGCKTVCAGEGGMIGEGPSPNCRRDGDCQGHRHPIHRHVAVELLQGAAGPHARHQPCSFILILGSRNRESSSSASPRRHPGCFRQLSTEGEDAVLCRCRGKRHGTMHYNTIISQANDARDPSITPLAIRRTPRWIEEHVTFPETRQPEMSKSH